MTLSIQAAAIGSISTLVGIGGGALYTPILIKLGYQPVTVSWTVNTSTFFSKVAAVFIIFKSGDILPSYVLLFGLVISAGIIVSENTILVMVKKYNSQLFYPVVFLTLLSFSVFLIIYVAADKAISDTQKNVGLFNFGSYC